MDQIETILNRGVEKIYPGKEELEKVLRSGRRLRIYQGFDPTGIKLHLGHLVGLNKLKHFQDNGHEVIFLIGDGTGQAGDPSGKTRSREQYLSRKELRENARDYVKQAGKIVRFEGQNPARILYNGDWLTNLVLSDFLKIAEYFSTQQLLERDMFEERQKKQERISLREFIYPVLQAYDSVVLEVDVEVGGNDQTFNMLCGRQLLHAMKRKNKFVLTTPLLTDASGKKIGKSEGNVIALNSDPTDLFGKIMSLPDEIIIKGLEYLTDIPQTRIKKITEEIEAGKNPMVFKKLLAFEIVKSLNDEKSASIAQTFFEQTHQHKVNSSGLDIHLVSLKNHRLLEAVAEVLAISKSQVKRLVEQKAIDVNGQNMVNSEHELRPGDIVKVGKHHLFKIK